MQKPPILSSGLPSVALLRELEVSLLDGQAALLSTDAERLELETEKQSRLLQKGSGGYEADSEVKANHAETRRQAERVLHLVRVQAALLRRASLRLGIIRHVLDGAQATYSSPAQACDHANPAATSVSLSLYGDNSCRA